MHPCLDKACVLGCHCPGITAARLGDFRNVLLRASLAAWAETQCKHAYTANGNALVWVTEKSRLVLTSGFQMGFLLKFCFLWELAPLAQPLSACNVLTSRGSSHGSTALPLWSRDESAGLAWAAPPLVICGTCIHGSNWKYAMWSTALSGRAELQKRKVAGQIKCNKCPLFRRITFCIGGVDKCTVI